MRVSPAKRDRPLQKGYQDHVRSQVKVVALAQVKAGGPGALSLNAIAKELGVSGPALYRYYSGRDELVSDLVLDSYIAMHEAMAHALDDASADLDPVDRLRRVVRAWHRYAREQPHRYRLLYAPPLPGSDASSDELVAAANRSMRLILGVVAAIAGEQAKLLAPDGHVRDDLGRQVDAWLEATSGLDPQPGDGAVAVHALQVWGRVHGYITLDLSGVYDSMGVDAAALLDVEVEDISATIRGNAGPSPRAT